ncbi:MAG: hypothetical protein SVU32_03480 [Candidatus Nanohaloarchaea archaeon]|nr:hypothetical protein [Candidatus Nanohaloarchaea archaeon]
MSDTLATVWDHAGEDGYTHTETDEEGLTKAVQIETAEGLLGEAFGALYAERIESGEGTAYRASRLEGPVPEGESLAAAPAHIEGVAFDYGTAPIDDLDQLEDEVEEAYMDGMMGEMLQVLDAALGEEPDENEHESAVDNIQPLSVTSRDDLKTIYSEIYEA